MNDPRLWGGPTFLVQQKFRIAGEQKSLRKCLQLPEYWLARAIRTIDARGCERVLLTSLTGRRRFEPSGLAACYSRRRWQIETRYPERKPPA